MVKIKPFPALIYNYDKKSCRADKVICPPYDVITTDEARFYRRLSRYNIIHLTLPIEAKGLSRYQAADQRFNDDLGKGVFCHDKQPAIYIYQQEFKLDPVNTFSKNKGTRFGRLGFIACLNLNSSSSIYGHEHTRIEPKEDRFKLLLEVKANLEPIFILYSDPEGSLGGILKRYIKRNKPLIRFRGQEKSINTLWKLSQPDILTKIQARMSQKTLFIADGHHRYEVSLNYQHAVRRSPRKHSGGDDDSNYIMTYFCPIQSSGLIIKPVHRLVRGIGSFPMDKFEKYFFIQRTTREKFFRRMQSRPVNRRVIGMYHNKNFYIFILRDKQIPNKIDRDYRHLDVCLLNHLVLKRLLRIDPEDTQRISFNANTQDLIRQGDVDRTSLAFFIKPVKINDIISLAKTGKKMPAKTTYFYPKVPSGLVIYKFSD